MKTFYKRIKNNIYFKDEENKASLKLTIDENQVVYIESLSVLSEFRRQGLAKKLFAKVMEFLKSYGYKIIKLNVFPSDHKNSMSLEQLKGFYSLFGFKNIPSSDRAYKNMMQLNIK